MNARVDRLTHTRGNMQASTVIRVGAVLMALAVMLGAFGAHAIRGRVEPDLLDIWRTATTYHAWHAIAVVLLGTLMLANGTEKTPLAFWFFIVGILVFSGSLYTLVLSGQRWLGAVTPIGGLAFIAGWLMLAIRFLK